MGANCAGSPVPTLKDNLLDHYHITSLMYYHEVLGNQTQELGVPYVLGETNSISVSSSTFRRKLLTFRTARSRAFCSLICLTVSRHAQHLRRLRQRALVRRLRALCGIP